MDRDGREKRMGEGEEPGQVGKTEGRWGRVSRGEKGSQDVATMGG